MRTRIVSIHDIDEIVEALRQDQLVALPTETVYGLAARAGSRSAVERIFAVKRRPADNPLIVHVASAEEAFALASHVPGYAERLAERFWPGPLTLVLPSAVDWPWVQAGHPTIALRVPEPGYLREVLRQVGPLAAPSANLSGRPSPTTAEHCRADLEGAVPLIVDGGACRRGVESTVVDCTGAAPSILRPGPVTAEMIGSAGSEVGAPGSAASPGTRHPHYRPRARVVLVDGPSDVDPDGEAAMVISARDAGSAATPGDAPADVSGAPRIVHRVFDSPEELARSLYAWFREADDLGLSTVFVQRVPERGIGAAVMNRLRKAARAGEGD